MLRFHRNVGFCCGIALLCGGPAAAAEGVHGYLTLTSDYVYRGISQSNEEPTVQGGLDYAHRSGFFAGLFGARVDRPTHPVRGNRGHVELDAYVGFSRLFARDWAWDVALFHYGFPDASASGFDYEEVAANLHYRDVLRLGATVSDNAIGGETTGWTAELEFRHPLGARTRVSGMLGHYAFQRADWSDYFYWDIGVSKTAGPWTFDLRYFDTSSGVESFAGTDLTGARAVASVSVGF